MGNIADALELKTTDRCQLSALLRGHPSFQLVSRYGWAVGRTRSELETQTIVVMAPAIAEHARRARMLTFGSGCMGGI